MIAMTKHHGLGNDFLVTFALDIDADHAALARRVCDRRRGIGADGLLIGALLHDGSADLRMRLFNADGSIAEMSGNGIRCFAQAALAHCDGPRLRIATDAGLRTVEVLNRDIDDGTETIEATVTMGAVAPIEAPAGWDQLGCDPIRPVAHLSVGNPHSVVAVDDVAAVDLAHLGAMVPQVNLEIVEVADEPDAIRMRVHERGAGITEACGTGACAAAVSAARWGLVSPDAKEIVVIMDGGRAKVRLDEPTIGEVTLVGPTTLVAMVQV
jgi:diaminopimelate epimerase